MKKLTHWTAKRSGASITITADQLVVTGIAEIKPKEGKVVATDVNGNDYELAPV